MKKYVVMGVTGMIGMALLRRILDNGDSVLAIDRPCEKLKNLPVHPNLQVLECDISQLGSVELDDTFDAFLHLAWKSVSSNQRDDVFAHEENIRYTLDAVELAHRLGCKCFVGAGSQAEYGRLEGLVSPASPINPDNAYGIAKYAAGKLSRVLCGQKGIRYSWARILSVYGPGDNESTMIMYCIKALLQNEKPVVTECGQMWDYIHCDDAARALVAIADYGLDGTIYCIGSGRERKMREYIEILKDTISPRLAIGYGERPYNENQVMRLCADISNLAEDTGFAPQVGFRQGIAGTIDWCKKEWKL